MLRYRVERCAIWSGDHYLMSAACATFAASLVWFDAHLMFLEFEEFCFPDRLSERRRSQLLPEVIGLHTFATDFD